jgi:hypothetical protein
MTGDERSHPVVRQALPVGQQDSNRTLTVPEAAKHLGKSADAIRSALRRGTLDGYRDNQGEWRIPLASLPHASLTPDGDGRELDALRQELEQARRLADDWQRQATDRQAAVAELRERVARLEGEAAGVRATVTAKDETVAALRDALADLAGRLDKATAELAEVRRPWWRRLTG